MAVEIEELIDEFHGLFTQDEEFPWPQQHPFNRAVREAVGSDADARAIPTRTMTGSPVILVIANDEVSVIGVTPDGVTTTYVGNLNGGILRSTVRRVDEFRRENTIEFEHERLPDGGIKDVMVERWQEERHSRLFEMLRPFSVPA